MRHKFYLDIFYGLHLGQQRTASHYPNSTWMAARMNAHEGRI